MELRWYQRDCIAAFYDYFARHSGNPIGALPTGTGKSYVIAKFFQEILFSWPGQRLMQLTHVQELIEQNHTELVELWPTAPAGIFSAGLGRKEVRPITFAGIQSVAGKASLFGHIDLVLIDECHLVSPADDTAYESFIADLRAINPKVKVVGLTATPYRLGQGMLTEPTERDGKTKPPLFTDICYDVTGVEPFNRILAEGYLAPLVPKQTGVQIDVSDVAIKGGEFVQGALQAAVDRDEITYAALQETIALAADRKHWLVFTTGIRHCEHVATMLDSLGISCVSVHSKTPKAHRLENVRRFKAGEVQALVNPVLYTVGFNYRAIDCIVDLAPTSSPSRHVQKYGRGTRTAEGKQNCLVLDFAGNTERNGPINDPRIPKRRRKGEAKEGTTSAPVRVCPHCATWNHTSVRFCTNCHEEFPPPDVKISAEASTESLIVGAAPLLEVYKVDRVEYERHRPHHLSGKPDSLRVEYFCGLRLFTEWICLEHDGYAAKRAREWWRTAADDLDTPPPDTVEAALRTLEVLQHPTHLRVWVNCRKPKIMAIDYSGTAFGSAMPPTN